MNIWIIIFFITILLVYLALNIYVGKKIIAIFNRPSKAFRIIYWVLLMIFTFAFFIGRLGNIALPLVLSTLLVRLGAYWLGLLVFMSIAFILIDIISLFALVIKARDNKLKRNKRFINALVVIFSIGLVLYGGINARNPKVIEYNIEINKQTDLDSLKIVLISDLHLGQILGDSFLERIIHISNSLAPDLILIPGDIIDDNLHPIAHQRTEEIFKGFKSVYGVYASMGNHEFIGGQAEDIERFLNRSNITVLRDESIKIEDSFYIIGREDKASERFTGIPRKSLFDIMEDVDRLYPIFMMDHQPIDITEAINQKVDLQVSGHTHKGQILPFRFFTNRIYDVDWGLYKERGYNLIVTSGVGTWGPPVRIGTKSEIVLINVSFTMETPDS